MTATAIQSIDWDAFYSELWGIEIISDRAQVVKLSQRRRHFRDQQNEHYPLDKTGFSLRRTGDKNVGFRQTSARNRLGIADGSLNLSHRNDWGFIGGGSGGIGSITYGQLRDRGNLHGVRVVTMEDKPRVIELRGDEVQKVNHAYGTNGIITELEIPLAPAYAWAEIIVAFDDFMTSANFGQALGDADGIIKKLICVCAWPIPAYFAAFREEIPEGKHCALLMVAESCLEPLQDLVGEYGGTICYQKNAQAASKGAAIAEFTWNHTTLHARSADPSLTYLQTLFPADRGLKLIEELYNYYGDEVMMHLEFLRMNGRAIAAALQIVRYSTESRLNEIIRYHEHQGALIANPHTYILEDGGMKSINMEQLQFKELVDPYGLLNPGKMRVWLERD
ncbi:FAD-binding oxidoreductase [Microcoleus asticus]|uniref:Uncharacterized protein n=1 Tax=Microcoleus asticus IPMA8 TaxID=2563858 RepID=A0ABX2CSY1_9CYAN|nr:hypothetical protein [Microcoleus asticus IPMA8]